MKLISRELREGNKIKANDVYQGKIMTFDRFNDDKTVCFFSDGRKWGIGEYLEDCEPVVLTSEILLACGFGFIDDNHDRYGWYLYISENRCLCWCHSEEVSLEFIKNNSDYNNTLFDFEIKHLHQLQNLYFALTNQELDVKL